MKQRLGRNGWSEPDRMAVWWVLGWTLLNVVQAVFTELFHDEAYYWVLSQRPQLGYAEHAPGVMLLIRLSAWLLPGELGVRVFPVLLSSGMLWLLYRMVRPQQVHTFFLLLMGVFGLHFAGFFAAPDAPMLFFAAAFLWAYERFLVHDGWPQRLLLALIVVALLYSKYHGAMLIFFVVLGNRRLFLRSSFWIVVGISTLLYAPHLWWLWEHDFGTFRFHLGERTPAPYTPLRTLEFWGGAFLLLGPFLGFLWFPAVTRRRAQDDFERSLKWSLWGILGFLTLLTLQARVEANWSASAMLPLLILAGRELDHWPAGRRAGRILALGSLPLILLFRLEVLIGFLPQVTPLQAETHGWADWAPQVQQLAEGRPVLFSNFYQYPAKYAFYSGDEALAASNLFYHRSQISEWTDLAALQGQPVLLMLPYHVQPADTFSHPAVRDFYFLELPHFVSYPEAELRFEQQTWVVPDTGSIRLPVTLENTGADTLHFRDDGDWPSVRIVGHLLEGNRQVSSFALDKPLATRLVPGERRRFELPIGRLGGVQSGTYRFTLSLAVDHVVPTRNSDWAQVEVRRE